MNRAAIDAYIALLPTNDAYLNLEESVKERVAFGAWEMLRRRYGAAVITDEMAALQALYIAEGEGEEFALFKRQGVKSIGLDGMSLSFATDLISPEVLALIESLNDSASGGSDDVVFGSWY